MSLTVWTVLWVDPEGKGFHYRTKPKDRPIEKEPEVRRYSPEDVQKYKRMVERRIPGARFRCLSNVDIPGVDILSLQLYPDLIAWWAKMALFSPELPHDEINVYYDLDTLLTADQFSIYSFDAPFAAIKPGPGVGSADQNDPHKPEPWAPWEDQEGKWRVPKYQTSCMVWKGDHVTRFWDQFQRDKESYLCRLASDQDFLGEWFPNEARMPTHWFRKIGKYGQAPKPGVKVVMAMPMRNEEAARRYPWVARIWN